MPFTTAEKRQLWELFSKDPDDLATGSNFLQAILDFEQSDTLYPDFLLVTTVRTQLGQLTALQSQSASAQSEGGLSRIRVDNHYEKEFDSPSSKVQGIASQVQDLISSIYKKLKFDDYMPDRRRAKVKGIMPMRSYRYYGRGYHR